MTGLEQAFYIMAIIYMGVMFLGMIVAIVAILAIRAKIIAIERSIAEKFHAVATVAHFGEELIGKAKKVFHSGK